MEYLSRVLAYTTDTLPFKFYPMCGQLKLSHLMFADDLLLFSKGDVTSIMVLLRSFATLSSASDVQMNSTKTNAYFNGVSRELKTDILQISGVIEGQLPFRYLGIPVTCGRLKKADCPVLVEKTVSRIRSFGTKKLSYAGRLVLVNSVLTALYSYWINIFLIPKGVLNKINSICRNYLWEGSVDYFKVPQVSWEKVCVLKTEGGLGIRDSLSWNIAAIGKLVWWIYSCPDRLWVKWVHQIYLKGTPWSTYTPSGDVSWGWKVVARVKDKLALGYSNDQWLLDNKGYTVSSGYDLIRLKFQEVQWHKYLWCSWCYPKHQFIGWLITREALKLKDKCYALGISSDATCLLCGLDDESHSNLFLKCEYNRRILTIMAGLCQVAIPDANIFLWINGLQASSVQKKVIMSVILATFYYIWMQRNEARIDDAVLRPELLCSQIRKEVKCRLSTKFKPGICTRDITWFNLVRMSM
ncbi:uncharacterized protein LOC141601204 [Silene latifolia]|uniref:uncharacterized protein LOC141601204 n=1 Tax=Silene latifolia TaxID=37657 RepID=UPI003D77B3FC